MVVTRNSIYKYRKEYIDELNKKYEADFAAIKESYPELASKLVIQDKDNEVLNENNVGICKALGVSDKAAKSAIALYSLVDSTKYAENDDAKSLKTAINAFLYDYAEDALAKKYPEYPAFVEKRAREEGGDNESEETTEPDDSEQSE